ncbi:MAG: ectoine synthase [Ilumatobacteraceae bacterium]|nr:ectoine synthase [Ilumatobacteraceae bacterium]
MIVRTLGELEDTELDVRADTWKSRRLLLAKDAMGFSLHDTVLYAGTETEMHYQNHLEAVYCIEGHAEITVADTGEVHELRPGTVYALDEHDRHALRVFEDFRCVCVFNPPVTGREVHDEHGVYPLLHESEEDATAQMPKDDPT